MTIRLCEPIAMPISVCTPCDGLLATKANNPSAFSISPSSKRNAFAGSVLLILYWSAFKAQKTL